MSDNFTTKDEEQLVLSLKNIVEAVKANPEQLTDYRKIFKKTVPFMLRSYVTAYLLKESHESGGYIHGFKKDRRNKPWEQSFKNTPFYKQPRAKVMLPENGCTSLFISIGRKKGVFPKDIITLLIQGAGILRDKIGDIRILDNYCFVQVASEDADSIIDKLNNSYYRGKSLTVSYSRKHDETAFVSYEEKQPMHSAPETETGVITESSEQPPLPQEPSSNTEE